MSVRRVVTGINGEGKSVIIADGPSPQEKQLKHTPGFVSAPIWQHAGAPAILAAKYDPMLSLESLLPGPGGSTFMLVTFPPDAVMGSDSFNPELAGAEHAAASPGLAETFEPENPGMHTTPTVDFAVVVDGSIVLELDDGATVSLSKGDTVVQQATRHAWRNPGDLPATLAVVLIGKKTD